MKIIVIEDVPKITLQNFAETHDLVMKVRGSEGRYMASFDHAEVKEGGMLASAVGRGKTVDEAIANYIPHIRGKLLVIDAMLPSRREIAVPHLKRYEPES